MPEHTEVVVVGGGHAGLAMSRVLAESGIDMVASTSNKCLHGLPGAAFVLISPRGQERIADVPAVTVFIIIGVVIFVVAALPRFSFRRS